MINPFFKNTGPYEINELLKLTSIKDQSFSDEKINDIKDLSSSKKGDMTFLHSKKYGKLAKSLPYTFTGTIVAIFGSIVLVLAISKWNQKKLK